MRADVSKLVRAAKAESRGVSGVSVPVLKKVAQRALDAWELSPLQGVDPAPWIQARLGTFVATAKGERGTCEDVDLLRPAQDEDPWAELIDAEARIAALAKSAIAGLTRTRVRKMDDGQLADTNRKLCSVYAKHGVAKAAGGHVDRDEIVAAAAAVQEELERRGFEAKPARDSDRELYTVAKTLRAEPTVRENEGSLVQTADGVELQLGSVVLKLAGRQLVQKAEDAAKLWSPVGTRYHTEFLEPAEAEYTSSPVPTVGHEIAKVYSVQGARTRTFTEFHVRGGLRGSLIVSKSAVMLRQSKVPFVLSAEAVDAGWLPDEGESALPPSLELDVPGAYRFWKAAAGEDPRVIRDALVASGLVDDTNLAIVDGELRRTVAKRFVVDRQPVDEFAVAPDELDPLEAALGCSRAVAKTEIQDGGGPFLLDGVPDAKSLQRAEFSAVACPDSDDARAVLKAFGRPFLVDGHVCVQAVPTRTDWDWLDQAAVQEEPTSGASVVEKRAVRILKSDADDQEERYVFGVVLEPEVEDAQGDVYSVEDIRKTAHRYMEFYQNVGLQHESLVNEGARIVESWVSPVDIEIDGQEVKKGTWLVGCHIQDDDLWEKCKNGDLTAWSIGGFAERVPEN